MELITKCTMSEFKDNGAEVREKLSPHFTEGEDRENADIPG